MMNTTTPTGWGYCSPRGLRRSHGLPRANNNLLGRCAAVVVVVVVVEKLNGAAGVVVVVDAPPNTKAGVAALGAAAALAEAPSAGGAPNTGLAAVVVVAGGAEKEKVGIAGADDESLSSPGAARFAVGLASGSVAAAAGVAPNVKLGAALPSTPPGALPKAAAPGVASLAPNEKTGRPVWVPPSSSFEEEEEEEEIGGAAAAGASTTTPPEAGGFDDDEDSSGLGVGARPKVVAGVWAAAGVGAKLTVLRTFFASGPCCDEASSTVEAGASRFGGASGDARLAAANGVAPAEAVLNEKAGGVPKSDGAAVVPNTDELGGGVVVGLLALSSSFLGGPSLVARAAEVVVVVGVVAAGGVVAAAAEEGRGAPHETHSSASLALRT